MKGYRENIQTRRLYDLINEYDEFIHSLLGENEKIVSKINYSIWHLLDLHIDFIAYGGLSEETINRFEEEGIKFLATRNKKEFIVYHFKILAKVEE